MLQMYKGRSNPGKKHQVKPYFFPAEHKQPIDNCKNLEVLCTSCQVNLFS